MLSYMSLKLRTDTIAWNADGSSTAQNEHDSWISHWETVTGLKRGVCSYVSCTNQAHCGGHIWILRGVYIAPICTKCNYHEKY